MKKKPSVKVKGKRIAVRKPKKGEFASGTATPGGKKPK